MILENLKFVCEKINIKKVKTKFLQPLSKTKQRATGWMGIFCKKIKPIITKIKNS